MSHRLVGSQISQRAAEPTRGDHPQAARRCFELGQHPCELVGGSVERCRQRAVAVGGPARVSDEPVEAVELCHGPPLEPLGESAPLLLLGEQQPAARGFDRLHLGVDLARRRARSAASPTAASTAARVPGSASVAGSCRTLPPASPRP